VADGLTLRIDDLRAPLPRRQVGALLQEIFGFDTRELESLAFWPEGYRAFSYLDGRGADAAVAANVSLLPMPLVVDGREVAAAGVQSVATRPDYRRRGLFRDLMARALAEAEARYECLLLLTETPALYRPFGFRALEQQAFHGRLPAAAGASASRILSPDSAADRALIHGLFERRDPPSRHLGLRAHEASFTLNTAGRWDRQLRLAPDGEALLVLDHDGGRLRLLDVVARRMPEPETIARLLAPLAVASDIEVLFPPDRLGGCFTARPYRHPEGDVLMVRGPFAIEGTAFMLPPTAAF